jgi:transglutaminase-like putative cysteine protease
VPLPPALAEPHTIRAFLGPETTIREMRRAILGPRGERSVVLHQLTEHVVRLLQPKDYQSEILGVRNFVAEHVRYKNDPLTTEWVSDPERVASQVLTYGRATADCDDIALIMAAMLRQVGRVVEWVTVGFGRPNNFSHVFARVQEPKSQRWIVVDPVAGSNEEAMLRRVSTYRIWRID